LALAAAAAVAVAALADPLPDSSQQQARVSPDVDLKRPQDPPAPPAGAGPAAMFASTAPLPMLDELLPGGCADWPCLGPAAPAGASLGGRVLAQAAEQPAADAFTTAAVPPERDGGELAEHGQSGSEGAGYGIEVTPAAALSVSSRGEVRPGAALRVAVPLREQRDLAIDATLQYFGTELERERTLAGSLGACWKPIAGRLGVSLCGTLGYERQLGQGRQRQVGYDRGGRMANDDWQLTAGAAAHAVWKLTREMGAYLAVQGVSPVAGDTGAAAPLAMRVMAGPQLTF
jgi:hypothetical protein